MSKACIVCCSSMSLGESLLIRSVICTVQSGKILRVRLVLLKVSGQVRVQSSASSICLMSSWILSQRLMSPSRETRFWATFSIKSLVVWMRAVSEAILAYLILAWSSLSFLWFRACNASKKNAGSGIFCDKPLSFAMFHAELSAEFFCAIWIRNCQKAVLALCFLSARENSLRAVLKSGRSDCFLFW